MTNLIGLLVMIVIFVILIAVCLPVPSGKLRFGARLLFISCLTAFVICPITAKIQAQFSDTKLESGNVNDYASPPQARIDQQENSQHPSFWLQTFITVCVSVVTTIITNWCQDRTRRKQMLQKEFTDAIQDLKQFSEDIAQLVVKHLVADPFSTNRQKSSHAEILVKLKLCGSRMKRASNLLNKTDEVQLEKTFLEWKSELTGAPFPVTRKEFACQAYDASVQKIHTAQEKWDGCLNSLTRKCMSGSLRVPLKKKQLQEQE